MISDKFRDAKYFTRGYASHLPVQLVDALKDERDAEIDMCMSLEGVQMYRAQGAATVLKEIVELLENGVDAPAPDAGISPIQ